MGNVYAQRGSNFIPGDSSSLIVHDVLPAGVYTVQQDDQTGQYYFNVMDPGSVPMKLYGFTPGRAERIINTFKSRKGRSTGVMLSGAKGSGKTLLARVITNNLLNEAIPTIIINQAHSGEAFNAFIHAVSQRAVVMFDEFEKTYSDRAEQNSILTLLDGVFQSEKLFIVTVNDHMRLSDYMLNRPGRFFYMIEFSGLTSEEAREFVEDRLADKVHTERVLQIVQAYGNVNFDMLQALIEEMNRYGESPREALRMLNFRPDEGGNSSYKGVLTAPDGTSMVDTWNLSPLSLDNYWVSVDAVASPKVKVDFNTLTRDLVSAGDQAPDNVANSKARYETYFSARDIVSFTMTQIHLKNKDGFTWHLTPEPTSSWHHLDAF